MTINKGMKEHIITDLPNGYKVSTLKIGRSWETMVFDLSGDEVYCHTEPYKTEARHYHAMAVYKYMTA